MRSAISLRADFDRDAEELWFHEILRAPTEEEKGCREEDWGPRTKRAEEEPRC